MKTLTLMVITLALMAGASFASDHHKNPGAVRFPLGSPILADTPAISPPKGKPEKEKKKQNLKPEKSFDQEPLSSGLKVTEIEKGGHRIPLEADFVIVEPNSKLEINIDKEKLKDIAGATLSPGTALKIRKIREVLAAEKKSLDNLNKAIEAYKNGAHPDVYVPLLQQQNELVTLVIRDTDGGPFYKSLPPDTSITVQYENIFKAAAYMLDKLQTRVLDEAKQNGLYIQLGAFLVQKNTNTPIHLPGFDSYDTQEPTTVERFQLVLTKEQSEDLQAISGLVNEINANGLPATIAKMKINIGQLLAGIAQMDSFKSAQATLKELDELTKSTDAELGNIKNAVKESRDALNDYLDLIQGFVDKYKQPVNAADGATLLANINTDVNELVTQTTKLEDDLKKNAGYITTHASTAAANIKGKLLSLTPAMGKLGKNIKDDLHKIPEQAATFMKRLISAERFSDQALVFSDKVKKLSIDDLPNNTTLDLETAGPRELGDQVTIKMAVGRTGQPIRELTPLTYSLYFCKVYARTAVGFLFVTPTPLFKRTDEKAFLRYAPSYSILLKGFWKNESESRKSLAYHEVWTPGLGLNVAALDFNGDGAPEVGLGGVFSIFNDFLQLGYGVNTFDGRGYAFLGIRLPFATFSLHP
jgi:hypothetical protein